MNRLQQWLRAACRPPVQVSVGAEPAPAGSRRPGSRRRRAAGHAALVLATALLAALNGTHVYAAAGVARDPASTEQVLVAVAVVLPLLLVPSRPMLAWRLGWLALLLSPLLSAGWWGGWPWAAPQLLVLLVAFCVAGMRQPRPVLWWMFGLSVLPWGWWLVRDIPNLNGPASATLVFTAVTIAVSSVGSRLRAQSALATQTVRTDTERARRAVLEERARIARELHDVVAHHLSLIAVQAETAPFRLGELPEPTRAEFAALSEVAREALTEMRRLLGVLRQDRSAELAPQPRLTEVPALVDSARRAGVAVDLSVSPGLDAVPAGVGVCAYRIVQESLSNASRHASGATVTVTVDQGMDTVLVRVANGPGAPVDRPSPPPAGPARPAGPAGQEAHGHGLTGMRERVALLGGSLAAGPTSAGGFEVSAVLPLREFG
ncbi:sensor histidine kinase [Streptacidiphilus jiangxiensis]|uniref:histidine kinase n=1 Tax=Streptacidiphilus jiangxiensis TaxID=235985 RepID=A0A1H7ZUS9_STRJI|nr:sensor histidine kinase [Streptacidiphilus jiangxiensis]SEM62026.1 Signal transduction histidine kinase [Streptacidiphilus jiangxiensis]